MKTDHIALDYEIYESDKMLWDMFIGNARVADIFVSVFVVNQGEEHKKKALRNIRRGELACDALFIDSREDLPRAIEYQRNIVDEGLVVISQALETMPRSDS